MPQFLADHNFNEDILAGLTRWGIQIDVLLAREVNLQEVGDGDLLAWAANQGMIVLTHDIRTLVSAAHDRVRAGESMPGVIAVPSRLSLVAAIESLAIAAICSRDADLANSVIYLPL